MSVFISYRRSDSAGYSGRLFDSLSKALGKDRVFMDVSGDIEPGVDFTEVLQTAVGSCEALVVMIGPGWVTAAGADGRRRLDDPEDWVRAEVAAALERQTRVIPVLVDGAGMPAADELPDDLKSLAKRNAIELSATRWDYDVETLIAALRRVLGEEEKKAAFPWLKWAAAAGALALAVPLTWWLIEVLRPEPGPVEVEIPALNGMTFEQAEHQLALVSLEALENEVETEEADAGRVFSHDPAAGEKRPHGSEVTLNVARLPRVEVPDLAGKTVEVARSELQARWLKVADAEQWKSSRDDAEGIVLSQEPFPGTAVERGTEIALTLARYPVREDADNSISASFFCAQKEALNCRDVKLENEEVPLSDLQQGEIAGKSTRVLYFSTIGELNENLGFLLHVWNREIDGANPVGERCQVYTSKGIGKEPLEEASATLAAAKDCLIVVMPIEGQSSKYRMFSMRSVPGPGWYSAEAQDLSRDRMPGAKRLRIKVVAD